MYSSKKISVAVLGSTGSVGRTTLKIISKHKKKFDIRLLVCNSNIKLFKKQILKFCPKYAYINQFNSRYLIKKLNLKSNTIILNDFDSLKKKFIKSKIKKTVLGISSVDGLDYAFLFAKLSNELLIANKESIICGGKLLIKEAKKNKCKITSIDSEHYCLSKLLKNTNLKKINRVYLTASGGPFLEKSKSFKNKVPISVAINHPNWSMGKKISIDSATMVNKILEVMEAHILFNIPFSKIKIKIHKESLVHSMVIMKNGLTNILAHDTSMIIPIRNSLFDEQYYDQSNNYFNNHFSFILSFDEKKLKNFDIFLISNKIFKLGHKAWILFNVVNDVLVNKYLNKEIFFNDIVFKLIKVFSRKSIIMHCKKKIRTISDIKKTINFGKKIATYL